MDLLIIDDFLTVGIDSDAASDLFAVLATREDRLPTMIASQTGPAHWVAELPDRVAADSILNRLANHARIIRLGQIDIRQHRNEQTRSHDTSYTTPTRSATAAARANNPGRYHFHRRALPGHQTGSSEHRYTMRRRASAPRFWT
ncbi:ATP-binding protein [Cryobacterium zhongshanensis]|uniref:ATP-binding protein n=1 Tax=Cryobacterium zhongshanensis TaxID=2928153 RepID=UPI0027E090F2|nr:ATP-binding protein [Cryobacterium zhongshanensis]